MMLFTYYTSPAMISGGVASTMEFTLLTQHTRLRFHKSWAFPESSVHPHLKHLLPDHTPPHILPRCGGSAPLCLQSEPSYVAGCEQHRRSLQPRDSPCNASAEVSPLAPLAMLTHRSSLLSGTSCLERTAVYFCILP